MLVVSSSLWYRPAVYFIQSDQTKKKETKTSEKILSVKVDDV